MYSLTCETQAGPAGSRALLVKIEKTEDRLTLTRTVSNSMKAYCKEFPVFSSLIISQLRNNVNHNTPSAGAMTQHHICDMHLFLIVLKKYPSLLT